MKIRCSTLSNYNDCPRRAASAQFRDIIEEMGEPLRERTAGIAPVFGTANHAGIEYALKYKMKYGKLPPIDDAIGAAHTEFTIQATDAEIVFDDKTPNHQVAKDQIAITQKVHREYYQNEMNPVAVEVRMSLQLGDGFELTGAPDEIDHSGTVNDLKTGTRDSNHAGQLGGYLILALKNGHKVNKAQAQWLPRPKKTDLLKPIDITYPPQMCVSVAKSVINQIKSDVTMFKETQNPWSFPANPASTMCSDKFCPAHGTKFCELTYNKPTKKERL